MIRLGVTGTDTGVGKTVVSCALAATLHRRGLRVTAMKPVETGVAFDDPARDGALLARAAGHEARIGITAPIVLSDPVAPMLAARRMGMTLDASALDAAIERAASGADVLIVEGAGGLLVPVTERESYDALFARWGLDVVIVAANRLGVINHTRLTIAAARAAHLRIRCIVLNGAAPDASDVSRGDNAALIAELEPGIPVFELPWMPDPRDLQALVQAAEQCGLLDAMP